MKGSQSTHGVFRKGLLAGAAITLVLPIAAVAQDSAGADDASVESDRRLNTIIVSASKRDENLQDVAASVSAVSGEDLAALGATDINDFVYKIPGLAFNQTDRSSNQLSIRGLTSFTSNPSEFPMVGAYVDEVPISETAIPDIGLIDLDRIEVLRGPQGTLYGEGSMGGTVKYVTTKPNVDAFEGFANGELYSIEGGEEGYKASGAVNIPLAEGVAALRIAGLYEDGAGFIDNQASGEENADAFERQGVRASLRVEPSEQLSFNLMAAYQTYEGGLPPLVFPNAIPGVTPPGLTSPGEEVAFAVAPVFSEDDVTILNGVIEYDFGSLVLTSSTSYYERERSGSQDEATTARIVEGALTPLTTFIGLGPFVAARGVRTEFASGNEVFSQEIRLATDGSSSFNYTVGAYYRERDIFFNNDTFSDDVRDLNPILLGAGLSGNPDYDGFLQIARAAVGYTQIALFGEATYDLTDQLSVTGGLRYFDEEIEGDQSITAVNAAVPGPTFFTPIVSDFEQLETSDDDILWKLGLAYDVNEDVLLFAQVATGFRPGGVNPRANPTPGADSPTFFSSDSVTSYEAGLKSELLDNRMTLNLSAYFTELEDAQFQDSRDPQFPVVRNSGGAEITGFEAELSALATEELTLGGTLSILNAEFSENSLPVPDGMGGVIFGIADGQQLPISRELTASAFAEYRHELSQGTDLVFYGDVSYAEGAPVNTVREETGTGFNFYTLDDYTLANIRVGLETDGWQAAVFIDNVTDEFVEVGGSPAFGIARDRPRSVGVRLGKTF